MLPPTKTTTKRGERRTKRDRVCVFQKRKKSVSNNNMGWADTDSEDSDDEFQMTHPARSGGGAAIMIDLSVCDIA